MNAMKMRLLLMGCIITILGTGLLAVRGYSNAYTGLIGVGIMFLVVGLLWKNRRLQKEASTSFSTDKQQTPQ